MKVLKKFFASVFILMIVFSFLTNFSAHAVTSDPPPIHDTRKPPKPKPNPHKPPKPIPPNPPKPEPEPEEELLEVYPEIMPNPGKKEPFSIEKSLRESDFHLDSLDMDNMNICILDRTDKVLSRFPLELSSEGGIKIDGISDINVKVYEGHNVRILVPEGWELHGVPGQAKGLNSKGKITTALSREIQLQEEVFKGGTVVECDFANLCTYGMFKFYFIPSESKENLTKAKKNFYRNGKLVDEEGVKIQKTAYFYYIASDSSSKNFKAEIIDTSGKREVLSKRLKSKEVINMSADYYYTCIVKFYTDGELCWTGKWDRWSNEGKEDITK